MSGLFFAMLKEGFFLDIAKSLEKDLEADLVCYARGKVGIDDTFKFSMKSLPF